jgi:hypothetical protein
MADDDLYRRLQDCKDDVRESVREVLRRVGLHDDVEIKSIEYYVKKRGPTCPPGQSPVWEAVQLPDGTIEHRLVCK